jgi:drug/metabolite transporter (DMT)-like permease
MATAQRSRDSAGSIVAIGHLLVGGAAFVFAGVMIVAGSDPGAELGGVLLPLGLMLALVAAAFSYTAAMVLRRAPQDRYAPSVILSIVELLSGAALVAGVVVALQSHGELWRSPLLLPSVLVLALGLAGLGLAVFPHGPTAGTR